MKKLSLFLSGCVLFSLTSGAQALKSGYIVWPESAQLHNYVGSWSKANPNSLTVGGKAWEDQNFFISRVKIKPYITNPNTQVYKHLNPDNDKKLLFWVPVGYANVNGFRTGSLPNGVFDSEVFSMWPYVTFYGDWISPYGWIPGGFADVAHKHGTAVSGQASTPNAVLPAGWTTCLEGMNSFNDDPEKLKNLCDFLVYHGVDGMAYNSEFNSTSTPNLVKDLSQLHGKVYDYMHNTVGNTKFENIWYTGTDINGRNDFTSALTTGNKEVFGSINEPRTSLFVNYEWFDYLKTTEANFPSTGRDSRDLYMGMNMQGGCKNEGEWLKHLESNYSIGLWGAHDFNYIWAERSGKGSHDYEKQACYQERLEQWFTNGNHNPADRIDVYPIRSLAPIPEWFGMSSFMTARSTLGWDLATEPFYSFFNLGNGKFFNWKGVRKSNSQWYNISAQDYMPTWRFWWATSVLGNTPDQVAKNGLKAEFTWEDAYVGGSCLRIAGNTENEYLHIFKTQFVLSANDVITVRYKLINGQTDLHLLLTAENNETVPVQEENLRLLSLSDRPDDGEWTVKTFRVADNLSELDGKTLALVGLHFEKAEDLDLYLGEFSIKKSSATATPVAPVVDKEKTKVFANNMSGVDGKIIFNMPNSKPSGEPVYNLDVNTSMFKLYAQFEGGEPQHTGVCTSWAGMYFSVPADVRPASKVRFGVSAVSLDTDSESEIAWSDYMDLPGYVASDIVTIDKKVIKPGESFTVGYSDPGHPASVWAIKDVTGNTVASSNGACVRYTCDGLDQIGGYDLVVDPGTDNERTFKYYVQVSAKEIGAIPEIQSLMVNGKSVDDFGGEAVRFDVNEKFDLGYTGREANGSASRGLRINSHFVGAPLDPLGLTYVVNSSTKSFTIAAWVKFDYPVGSSSCLSVENRAGKWPENNWGFFWMDLAGKNGGTSYGKTVPAGGVLSYTIRTYNGSNIVYNFSNSVIPDGAWTHLAVTFDWSGNGGFKSELYINGIKQIPVAVDKTDGTPTKTDDVYFWAYNDRLLTKDLWFCLGGGRGSGANFNDGVVDDLVVWQGAMTADEVRTVMAGVDADNIPSKVIAYWDMEKDAESVNNTFPAVGSKSGVELINFIVQSGLHLPTEPVYEVGSPFITGTAYPVVTKPTWKVRKNASVSNASGDDKSGSATVSFPRQGDYSVILKLDNSYGSDEKEYPVITVEDTSGIEDVVTDVEKLDAYAINGTLFIDFANEGLYTVNVYNVSGLLVGKKTQNINGGEKMSISLSTPGVYIVNVLREGNVVRNIKIFNK